MIEAIIGVVVVVLILLYVGWDSSDFPNRNSPAPMRLIEGPITAVELVAIVRERPKGVVGIVVANYRHANVVIASLLRAMYLLDNVVRRPDPIIVRGTRIICITRPEQMIGMRFDLILEYSVLIPRTMRDSELRVRLNPEGAWSDNIHQLLEDRL